MYGKSSQQKLTITGTQRGTSIITKYENGPFKTMTDIRDLKLIKIPDSTYM